MKSYINLKKITAGLVGAFLLFAQLFVFSVNEASAAIDRNFTLPGGGIGTSVEVSSPCHNSLRLRARVSLRRQGSDNTFSRKRVRMVLINPSGQPVDTRSAEIGNEGGNQVLNGDTGSENGSPNDPYTLTAPAALGGSNQCSEWKVRIINFDTNQAVASQQVTGTVTFTLVGNSTVTIPAPTKFGIVQSDTAIRNIAVPFTGTITIQANWDTDEITLDNYQLRFELIRPDGTVVDSDTGYSRDSLILGISNSQRMRISYTVKCADFNGNGSWRIRVKGSTLGKVKNVDLKMSINDGVF